MRKNKTKRRGKQNKRPEREVKKENSPVDRKLGTERDTDRNSGPVLT